MSLCISVDYGLRGYNGASVYGLAAYGTNKQPKVLSLSLSQARDRLNPASENEPEGFKNSLAYPLFKNDKAAC